MKPIRKRPLPTRRPGDLAFAVTFLGVVLGLAIALPWQAPFVGSNKLIAQPAFWPMVGVTMMVIFGTIHLLGTANRSRTSGRAKEVWLWVRSLEFVVWFVGYVWVIQIIGYLPGTLAFVLLLSLRLGYRSGRILASGAIFSLCVVLVFKTGLGVALPIGQVYEFLPEGIRNFVMANF